MMLFVDKLDQFGCYRWLYTSAREVVEEDAPGRHQLCCVCSDRTPGDKVMAHHCCSTIVLTVALSLASFPGLQEEEQKGPGTHCTRMHWGFHSDRSYYHSDHLRVLHDVRFYG